MTILQHIGKTLINFSVRRLGVSPYMTDLVPFRPTEYLPVQTSTYYPVRLQADFFIDSDYGSKIPKRDLLFRLAQELGDKEFIRFREEDLSDNRTKRYIAEIAVMPVQYIEQFENNLQ